LEKRIKVLVAKPGLDGHDRGAKVVAQALKDAGMEVVYSDLHKTVDEILHIALQEDVDVIGLSIMSGAHLPITEKLIRKAKEQGLEDKMIVVGGVNPAGDVTKLKAMGVQCVFPGGVPFTEIVDFLKEHVKKA